MGISFGKRKVKIKLLGQTETVTEEEKPKVPVPIYQLETVSKAKPKVNRTFKEALKEITEQSKNLNLSDFTVYQYYYSDGRYIFRIRFTADGYTGEAEVNAATGKVIEWTKYYK